jgi:hypothetical protein
MACALNEIWDMAKIWLVVAEQALIVLIMIETNFNLPNRLGNDLIRIDPGSILDRITKDFVD